MTSKTISNAIARKYFTHANDFNQNGMRCCFFSLGTDSSGWGFWVAPNGRVDVDDVSANGDLPSKRIVDACVRSAMKYLRADR